jgi:hypothetical protein
MNVSSTVYLAVFLYVFSTVLTVLKMRTVSAPLVFALCTLSLPLRCAVTTASCVAQQRKRRQIATFNKIRPARLNSGSQRQLVQARPCCALKCHGNLG